MFPCRSKNPLKCLVRLGKHLRGCGASAYEIASLHGQRRDPKPRLARQRDARKAPLHNRSSIGSACQSLDHLAQYISAIGVNPQLPYLARTSSRKHPVKAAG